MPQETLEWSDAAFRFLVENTQDIIGVCDAEGCFRYASPSIERVLGYRQEEFTGAERFDLVHPDDHGSVVATLNELVKTPGARDCIQYRARHANGSWVSLEVVAYNMLDHPVVRGVLLSGRDFSQCSRTAAQPQQPTSVLSGVLSTCCSCKMIRDHDGKWENIEVYLRDRLPVEFSHGICPNCAEHLYPEHFKK